MTGLLWAAIAATLASGFFALASYSLRDFRRGVLEAAFGPQGAGKLDCLERHLPSLRLLTSLCRSIANVSLMLSLLGLLGHASPSWPGLLGALALAAGIIAVFGVAIPQAWASASAPRIVSAILRPLLVLRWALYPVLAAMQALEVPVRRLSGEKRQEDETEEARQEIREAASEGEAEGAVDAEEVAMIESVIEFGDIQAAEIMTPRTDIVALPTAMTWADACRQAYEAGHSRIPVYEGDIDNIVGILYAKDLLRHVSNDRPLDLRSMLRKPFFVPETKRLDDLLREFKSRKVHIAVVLDEYGGTAGLVSIEDVLEEIVGDIADEYDLPEPALMKRLDDATAEVDGRMYIDDLNKAMKLLIPEDDRYDTVAGFLFSELGYVPSAGETLDAHAARFTILAADERRITRIRVQRLPRPSEQ